MLFKYSWLRGSILERDSFLPQKCKIKATSLCSVTVCVSKDLPLSLPGILSKYEWMNKFTHSPKIDLHLHELFHSSGLRVYQDREMPKRSGELLNSVLCIPLDFMFSPIWFYMQSFNAIFFIFINNTIIIMFITGFDLDFTVMGETTFWLKCTGWNFYCGI